MKLVTLQRHAPVTPGAVRCQLCDAPIEGTVQNHVLVGAPGVSQIELTICSACGEAIQRLVDVAGPELSVVVQGGAPGVERRARGPSSSVPDRGATEATLEDARRKLATEAERLRAVRPPAP